MKYKTKANEKGITLIALIITIIILVILVAISIKAVYESKIVYYAINGATDYVEESVRENEIINSTESLLESTISKISKITGGSEEGINFSSLSDKEKEELIGKYVAYKPTPSTFSDHTNSSVSGYSYNTTLETDEDLNWRILFIDDDKITLISETPTNDGFWLEGALGYNNAVKLLNEACATMYSSNELNVTARSLNIEDIEDVSNYQPEDYAGEYTYGQIETYSGSNLYYPSIFASEKLQKVDNETEGSLGQSQQGSYITEGRLRASSYITATQTFYGYVMSEYMDSIYSEMLGGSRGSYSYRLASRCVDLNSSTVAFYVFSVESGRVVANYLCDSGGGSGSSSNALRPVVDINLESVSIGASGEGTSEDPYTITAK